MAAQPWPSITFVPEQFSIQPIDTVIGDASPWTGARQVMLRYHQWHAVMTWNVLRHNDGHQIHAHLSRCRGGLDILQIPIFSYRGKRGTKSGSVTLSGSHAVDATSLTVTGGSGTFLQGDWFHINQATDVPRAYQVVSSESAGVIKIVPGLRVAHSNGTALNHTVGAIYDTMEVVGDPSFGSAMPSPTPGYFQSFTIEFVSALRASP